MKIVWIASYPKSGNTLVRLLLHNYLYGITENTDLIGDRIPDIYRLLTDRQSLHVNLGEPKLIKSHFCFSSQHPYVKSTAGFIYILRNPRDVLLSNARYLGIKSKWERRRFAEVFIAQYGVPRWQESGMGSWPENVESWMKAATKIPHLFVKYEDLRADTETLLAHMIQFLGHQPEPERLRAAVASCTLEKTRQQEKVEKKLGRTGVYNEMPSGTDFVGTGQMGQSLEVISVKVEAQFQERFAPVAKKFGYG